MIGRADVWLQHELHKGDRCEKAIQPRGHAFVTQAYSHFMLSLLSTATKTPTTIIARNPAGTNRFLSCSAVLSAVFALRKKQASMHAEVTSTARPIPHLLAFFLPTACCCGLVQQKTGEAWASSCYFSKPACVCLAQKRDDNPACALPPSCPTEASERRVSSARVEKRNKNSSLLSVCVLRFRRRR